MTGIPGKSGIPEKIVILDISGILGMVEIPDICGNPEMLCIFVMFGNSGMIVISCIPIFPGIHGIP